MERTQEELDSEQIPVDIDEVRSHFASVRRVINIDSFLYSRL